MSAATALYFGPPARPLFGWLHRPAVTQSALGVVLCNPFGYEAICAHRSIRQFAEQLAHAGHPTIRFDYDGTGDSAGDALDPQRLEAWVASTSHAIDALRERSGVTRVALLGIRLGATVAALCASARDDVTALIAIVPAVSARAYVREMRMLQLAMDAQRGVQRELAEGTLESCGFVLSAATQDELKALDLTKLQGPLAPHILLIERAGMPANEQWPEQLRSAGAQVERCALEGFAEMMLDSHKSIVPEAIIAKSVQWLSTLPEAAERSQARSVSSAPAVTYCDESGVAESAVTFGSSQQLFGIVSTSARLPPNPSRRAILLLTAGAVHHVGPNRAYVTLARHWAAQGYVVLRLDIGGTGDSAYRPGALERVVYSAEVIQDIASAIDYLRWAWQVSLFDAVGLCSGAYHALRAASAGLPLTSITLINPLTFRYHEGLSLDYPDHRVSADIARYRSNVLRPQSWLKLLRGGVDLRQLSQVLLRRALGYGKELLSTIGHLLHLPMRNDLGAQLTRISSRGVALRFIFAAEEPGIELLRAKGGLALRRLQATGRLQIHLIAGADHTFTDREPREQLLRYLAEKLDDGPVSLTATAARR